jgi:hypothetical protein
MKKAQTVKPKINDIVGRIIKLNAGLYKFWSKSHGWAPIEAAGLLSKSRLDWQVSLSETLGIWTSRKKPLTPGELILAWTNLGSLVEGTLKTFLSVWYKDYAADVDHLKLAKVYNHKKDQILEPEGLTLELLKRYFNHKELLSKPCLALVELVQQRRNAVHAFKDKKIGNTAEFHTALASYLDMLREVNLRLPYPDDIYAPSEI